MIVLLVAGCGSVAGAEPFWIAWEADDYPENEGWERYTRAGGAERSLEDGTLILDGMASTEIVDIYYIQSSVVPAPGEQFRIDWRLRVDEVQGFADPLVAVRAADLGAVFLHYSEEYIYSELEGVWIQFAPTVYHDFSFTSADMVSYELRIDGLLAYSGHFLGPWVSSGVTWGDATEGASSLSVWDYVRFGIVPEPSAGLLLGSAGLAALRLRTPRIRRNIA